MKNEIIHAIIAKNYEKFSLHKKIDLKEHILCLFLPDVIKVSVVPILSVKWQ